MKRVSLTIPWTGGLHLRPAALLVRLAQGFTSSIRVYANGRMADARSVIAVLMLCAAAQSRLEIEAVGEDEDHAIQAVEHLFRQDSHDQNAGMA